MRTRDMTEVSMIRTLVAAIENAEVVDAELSWEPKIGLNHDQRRRLLSDDEIAAIVSRERMELAEALGRYRELGPSEELADLEEQMAIVDRYA